MTPIGKCTFPQLPKKYQQLFDSGANLGKNGRFIPEKNFSAIIINFLFLYLFASIPALFIAEYNFKPLSLIGLLLFSPLIVLTVIAVAKIRELITTIKNLKQGIHNYGLLIDDENIVLRKFDTLYPKNCIFVPRQRMINAYAKWSTGRRATRFPSYFVLAYKDTQGQTQWVNLAGEDTLEFNLFQLNDLFMAMGKVDINGEWSQSRPKYEIPPYDTVIYFDEPNGKIVEWFEGKPVNEILFTFEQTGKRELVLKGITSEQNPLSQKLEAGTYTFTIKVKLEGKLDTNKVSRYYLLRFEQEFLGSSIIDFGQEVG